MNVLLIYPEFPDTFWSFKHALRFIKKKAALPPLGLVTLAAMLPESWSLRLVDLNVTRLDEEDLQWADIAFVSAMAVQRESAHRVLARCRQSNVRTVAGGPLFQSEHDRFEEVDHFVLNEAEITLPEFLADLEGGTPPRPMYTASEYCDLRETPAPRWDLLDLNRYATMSVQFSRGCPFNCDFCNVTALFGRKTRMKTAEQVIQELDGLYTAGWRGQVFFVDDNFIGPKTYLKTELLPALIRWRQGKKGLPFNTEASVNLADDPELMDMMREAGFDAVFVGIETTDEKSLSECNKTQNKNRDLIESVKAMQRAGLQVTGGFIVGFDSDTPSVFQRQIDFIQKSGIVTAMVGLLQAPPGTALYERMKREGRLLGKFTGDNVDGTTNIVPRMDPKFLYDGYRYIMNQIYSPKHYYKRIRTFLREYRPPKSKAPLDLQRLLAFFRSSLHLGVLGRERLQYWKLVFWTLSHRPRFFSLAITLGIYGHHFQKILRLRLPVHGRS